jgi:hypothetical protein
MPVYHIGRHGSTRHARPVRRMGEGGPCQDDAAGAPTAVMARRSRASGRARPTVGLHGDYMVVIMSRLLIFAHELSRSDLEVLSEYSW